jgi:hypothetical protein
MRAPPPPPPRIPPPPRAKAGPVEPATSVVPSISTDDKRDANDHRLGPILLDCMKYSSVVTRLCRTRGRSHIRTWFPGRPWQAEACEISFRGTPGLLQRARLARRPGRDGSTTV